MAYTRTNSQLFLANGTWVCPQGVTICLVQGFGGGGGGANGSGTSGGGGGGGSVLFSYIATVVPGTSYNIIIGGGGTAGVGGNRTDFDTIVGFVGAGNGGAVSNTFGGTNYNNTGAVPTGGNQQPGYGGNGATVTNVGASGYYPSLQINYNNVGGSSGGTSGVSHGGGGGGGGTGPGILSGAYQGGNGGNGMTGSTTGGAGGNGTANSGSGGGGGGGSATGSGGAGGTGGSGQLTVMWIA
jgi:hypothetical protein